jgi:Metallo-beta-lactamase superfamily
MTNDEYQVYAVEYGWTMDQPVGLALAGHFNEGINPMPYGFVVARSKSRVVLVDMGFESVGSGDRMRVKFHVDPYISPVRALKAMDIKPQEVTDVIVTHAHYDHMGSLASFPSAHFYLQKEELAKWKWALGKGRPFANLTAACNPDDVAQAEALVAARRMTLLSGPTRDVVPGISVEVAPESHSYMLQFAVIERTARGRMIAAGDGAFSLGNFPAPDGDGAFTPLGFGVGSLTGMVLGLEKLYELAGQDLDRIIIVHENKTYEGSGVTRIDGGMRVRKLA